MLLLLAVLVVAVLWVNVRKGPRPEAPGFTQVVVATTNIEPYSIVSPSQVILGSEPVPLSIAGGYYTQPEQVAGLMTTRFIRAGQQISREDARSLENVRYVADMTLEIVSFPAIFNEMVAGQVKPGHRINIYGYRRGNSRDDPGELVWVAGNVWVVDVRTAAGDVVVSPGEGSQQDLGRAEPASVVTVAALPETVQDIIRAFGAGGYNAWVTLAPSPVVPVAPTPVPTPTAPTGTATPTTPIGTTIPTAPNSGTAAGIVKFAVHMAKADGGAPEQHFVNGSEVVYVAVELEYSPPLASAPIEIEILKGTQQVYPRSYFTQDKSPQWYGLRIAGGLPANAEFLTKVYAGGQERSVQWWSSADGALDKSGDDSAHDGD